MPNIIQTAQEKIENFIKPSEDIKQEELKVGDNKKEALRKLKFRLEQTEILLKPKIQAWEKSLKFFNGDHWEVAGVTLPTYKAGIVINKFFAAVRSLVAFETDARPDPEVDARVDKLASGAEGTIKATKKVESMLDYRWDMLNIPNILTEIYYDRYIFDDGFGMYFWNLDVDDVDFEQIKPYELFIAPGASSLDDADFLIVKKRRSKKWFTDNFPDDVDDIKFEGVQYEEYFPFTQEAKKTEYENMASVYHYFENELWATFTDNKVLEIMDNPNWEFRTEREQLEELKKVLGAQPVPDDWVPVKNHLLKPEKPIVHFKGYHLGGELYSRSLAKQAFQLNIAVDKRKSQIQDNADGVGNGQWVIDPSVPLDKVNLITSEPGLKIRINPSLARKEPGMPLPEFVFADLQHSEQKFDDMMGHHDVSRGAGTSKRQTARETMLLRETDITPVRLLMRNSEHAITRMLNGWVQLQKLFYDEAHYVGKFGSSMKEETGSFLTRKDIPDSLSIVIRAGSTLPTSKETKRQEYQRDLAAGILDPLTYLELMDYPNPRKILQRNLNWQRGIIGEEEGGGQQLPPQEGGQGAQQPAQFPGFPQEA